MQSRTCGIVNGHMEYGYYNYECPTDIYLY